MMAKKMKALIMTEQGGPEVLGIAEVDKPEIKKDIDVLAKVIAAGVNPADWQNRKNGAPSYAVEGNLPSRSWGSTELESSKLLALRLGMSSQDTGSGITTVATLFFWGSYAQYEPVDSALLRSRPKNVCRSSNLRSDIVVIDRVVTFDGVGEAHRALEADASRKEDRNF